MASGLDGGSWSCWLLTMDCDCSGTASMPLKTLMMNVFYTWHLLHFCPSWERDPSHVALSEVSTYFYPVKRVFSSFSSLLLRVKDRGCHTLLKPYEMNVICEYGLYK